MKSTREEERRSSLVRKGWDKRDRSSSCTPSITEEDENEVKSSQSNVLEKDQVEANAYAEWTHYNETKNVQVTENINILGANLEKEAREGITIPVFEPDAKAEEQKISKQTVKTEKQNRNVRISVRVELQDTETKDHDNKDESEFKAKCISGEVKRGHEQILEEDSRLVPPTNTDRKDITEDSQSATVKEAGKWVTQAEQKIEFPLVSQDNRPILQSQDENANVLRDEQIILGERQSHGHVSITSVQINDQEFQNTDSNACGQLEIELNVNIHSSDMNINENQSTKTIVECDGETMVSSQTSPTSSNQYNNTFENKKTLSDENIITEIQYQNHLEINAEAAESSYEQTLLEVDENQSETQDEYESKEMNYTRKSETLSRSERPEKDRLKKLTSKISCNPQHTKRNKATKSIFKNDKQNEEMVREPYGYVKTKIVSNPSSQQRSRDSNTSRNRRDKLSFLKKRRERDSGGELKAYERTLDISLTSSTVELNLETLQETPSTGPSGILETNVEVDMEETKILEKKKIKADDETHEHRRVNCSSKKAKYKGKSRVKRDDFSQGSKLLDQMKSNLPRNKIENLSQETTYRPRYFRPSGKLSRDAVRRMGAHSQCGSSKWDNSQRTDIKLEPTVIPLSKQAQTSESDNTHRAQSSSLVQNAGRKVRKLPIDRLQFTSGQLTSTEGFESTSQSLEPKYMEEDQRERSKQSLQSACPTYDSESNHTVCNHNEEPNQSCTFINLKNERSYDSHSQFKELRHRGKKSYRGFATSKYDSKHSLPQTHAKIEKNRQLKQKFRAKTKYRKLERDDKSDTLDGDSRQEISNDTNKSMETTQTMKKHKLLYTSDSLIKTEPEEESKSHAELSEKQEMNTRNTITEKRLESQPKVMVSTWNEEGTSSRSYVDGLELSPKTAEVHPVSEVSPTERDESEGNKCHTTLREEHMELSTKNLSVNMRDNIKDSKINSKEIIYREDQFSIRTSEMNPTANTGNFKTKPLDGSFNIKNRSGGHQANVKTKRNARELVPDSVSAAWYTGDEELEDMNTLGYNRVPIHTDGGIMNLGKNSKDILSNSNRKSESKLLRKNESKKGNSIPVSNNTTPKTHEQENMENVIQRKISTDYTTNIVNNKADRRSENTHKTSGQRPEYRIERQIQEKKSETSEDTSWFTGEEELIEDITSLEIDVTQVIERRRSKGKFTSSEVISETRDIQRNYVRKGNSNPASINATQRTLEKKCKERIYQANIVSDDDVMATVHCNSTRERSDGRVTIKGNDRVEGDAGVISSETGSDYWYSGEEEIKNSEKNITREIDNEIKSKDVLNIERILEPRDINKIGIKKGNTNTAFNIDAQRIQKEGPENVIQVSSTQDETLQATVAKSTIERLDEGVSNACHTGKQRYINRGNGNEFVINSAVSDTCWDAGEKELKEEIKIPELHIERVISHTKGFLYDASQSSQYADVNGSNKSNFNSKIIPEEKSISSVDDLKQAKSVFLPNYIEFDRGNWIVANRKHPREHVDSGTSSFTLCDALVFGDENKVLEKDSEIIVLSSMNEDATPFSGMKNDKSCNSDTCEGKSGRRVSAVRFQIPDKESDSGNSSNTKLVTSATGKEKMEPEKQPKNVNNRVKCYTCNGNKNKFEDAKSTGILKQGSNFEDDVIQNRSVIEHNTEKEIEKRNSKLIFHEETSTKESGICLDPCDESQCRETRNTRNDLRDTNKDENIKATKTLYSKAMEEEPRVIQNRINQYQKSSSVNDNINHESVTTPIEPWTTENVELETNIERGLSELSETCSDQREVSRVNINTIEKVSRGQNKNMIPDSRYSSRIKNWHDESSIIIHNMNLDDESVVSDDRRDNIRQVFDENISNGRQNSEPNYGVTTENCRDDVISDVKCKNIEIICPETGIDLHYKPNVDLQGFSNHLGITARPIYCKNMRGQSSTSPNRINREDNSTFRTYNNNTSYPGTNGNNVLQSGSMMSSSRGRDKDVCWNTCSDRSCPAASCQESSQKTKEYSQGTSNTFTAYSREQFHNTKLGGLSLIPDERSNRQSNSTFRGTTPNSSNPATKQNIVDVTSAKVKSGSSDQKPDMDKESEICADKCCPTVPIKIPKERQHEICSEKCCHTVTDNDIVNRHWTKCSERCCPKLHTKGKMDRVIEICSDTCLPLENNQASDTDLEYCSDRLGSSVVTKKPTKNIHGNLQGINNSVRTDTTCQIKIMPEPLSGLPEKKNRPGKSTPGLNHRNVDAQGISNNKKTDSTVQFQRKNIRVKSPVPITKINIPGTSTLRINHGNAFKSGVCRTIKPAQVGKKDLIKNSKVCTDKCPLGQCRKQSKKKILSINPRKDGSKRFQSKIASPQNAVCSQTLNYGKEENNLDEMRQMQYGSNSARVGRDLQICPERCPSKTNIKSEKKMELFREGSENAAGDLDPHILNKNLKSPSSTSVSKRKRSTHNADNLQKFKSRSVQNRVDFVSDVETSRSSIRNAGFGGELPSCSNTGRSRNIKQSNQDDIKSDTLTCTDGSCGGIPNTRQHREHEIDLYIRDMNKELGIYCRSRKRSWDKHPKVLPQSTNRVGTSTQNFDYRRKFQEQEIESGRLRNTTSVTSSDIKREDSSDYCCGKCCSNESCIALSQYGNTDSKIRLKKPEKEAKPRYLSDSMIPREKQSPIRTLRTSNKKSREESVDLENKSPSEISSQSKRVEEICSDRWCPRASCRVENENSDKERGQTKSTRNTTDSKNVEKKGESKNDGSITEDPYCESLCPGAVLQEDRLNMEKEERTTKKNLIKDPLQTCDSKTCKSKSQDTQDNQESNPSTSYDNQERGKLMTKDNVVDRWRCGWKSSTRKVRSPEPGISSSRGREASPRIDNQHNSAPGGRRDKRVERRRSRSKSRVRISIGSNCLSQQRICPTTPASAPGECYKQRPTIKSLPRKSQPKGKYHTRYILRRSKVLPSRSVPNQQNQKMARSHNMHEESSSSFESFFRDIELRCRFPETDETCASENCPNQTNANRDSIDPGT